jgi:chlorophyllide a oxygenase
MGFNLYRTTPRVAFRDADGKASCIKDECAHRACPISLGKLVEGKVQCPYHGWEYTSGGEVVKMPSIKKLLPNVYVDAAPVVERDGLLYVWAGQWAGAGHEAEVVDELPGSLAPPPGFTAMAEVTVDIPDMEAEEVLARLMDLNGRSAPADKVPFDRVSDAVSDDFFPKIVAGMLLGFREKPVPRSVSFLPTCILESTIGLEGAGGDWSIHQMHVVLPARPGRSRVLFRLSTDFVLLPEMARSIGGQVWRNLAEMVLHEQLEGVREGGGGGEAAAAAACYEEFRRGLSSTSASAPN